IGYHYQFTWRHVAETVIKASGQNVIKFDKRIFLGATRKRRIKHGKNYFFN
ncbi:Hypothetical predicted protein, partial [Mytilus galloprovincialis]